MGVDNARKSQLLVSSIILLKTALDALPLLSRVNLFSFSHIQVRLLCCMFQNIIVLLNSQVLKDATSSLLANVYKSVCENEKYAAIRKRFVAKHR